MADAIGGGRGAGFAPSAAGGPAAPGLAGGLFDPEDLILYKLYYFSLSEQPKHTRDIASILLAEGENLDYEYIQHGAHRQGLDGLWRKVRCEVRSRNPALSTHWE
ncbi:MAG TPA: hypothetical protein EYP85_10835 [Armatimonadetes bacterium]|nr:hypothetical protein [Armatimonadota bacterium]